MIERMVARHRKKPNRPGPGVSRKGAPGGEPVRGSPERQAPVDYRGLFERAPDAILVVDNDGRYIEANPAACKLTGYSRQELLQLRVGELTTASERPQSLRRLELLREKGQTRGNRILQRKDGTCVPVEAHAVALENGTFQTVLRDMSEHVAAREKLQRSLDAYSTLVDLCHAAVVSAGSDGRLRSWNPGAKELFGYDGAEAIGLPVRALVPPHLRRKHLAGFRRHARSSRTAPFARTLHTEALRKDGTEVPVEVSIAVGWQEDDRIFTAVIRDVSEHQAVVERLNDALQQLQFHMERMPLAYIVWDVDFRVVEWNPSAERIFGYSKKEATGRRAYDLIVPPDVVPAVEAIWSDLLKGDTSSHSVNDNVRKDGSRLTCEWFNTPLRDSAGRIRGVASMTMDVSEREELESRIRDTQRLESMGLLAGGIAHDFNSSLMVILGNTALLRSAKRLPTRALEHIELIEQAGSRAHELIQHLLAYARTGRHNPQPVDVNAVIREGLTLVRSSISPRHRLDLRLAERLPSIVADRSQLEQIILNLCVNAQEAMPEGGCITLSTRSTQLSPADVRRCVPFDVRPGPYVEMVVTDTGCGMDKATVSRMFDPFFSTKADGHGLGMAAVLGILRQHKAAALVESAQGKGTRVSVYFPVLAGATDPGPSRARS